MRSNQLSYRAIQRSGVVVSRLRLQKYDKFSNHQNFYPLFLQKIFFFGFLAAKIGLQRAHTAAEKTHFDEEAPPLGRLFFQSLRLIFQSLGLDFPSLRLIFPNHELPKFPLRQDGLQEAQPAYTYIIRSRTKGHAKLFRAFCDHYP